MAGKWLAKRNPPERVDNRISLQTLAIAEIRRRIIALIADAIKIIRNFSGFSIANSISYSEEAAKLYHENGRKSIRN